LFVQCCSSSCCSLFVQHCYSSCCSLLASWYCSFYCSLLAWCCCSFCCLLFNVIITRYMQAIVVEYNQKLHSLQVHARFLKMIQMDMVVILKICYPNIWIIYVQSPLNLSKFIWKLVFNVVDVIF
jgi:hypothetical protein